MTLVEMKEKVYQMIEEYNEDADDLTEDEDYAVKMNSIINQIQNEVARYKKLDAKTEFDVTKGREMLLSEISKDFYQLNVITGVDYDLVGNTIIFNEDGKAKVYYFKYPKQINSETDDNFKFELSTDCLEIMPYGIAGDLLKSDVSSQYGVIYSNRYKELLQTLDPRKGNAVASYSGGVDL